MPAEIIPLHDWIILEPEEYKTEGGIVIPDGVDVDPETQSKTGRVVAIGTGVLLETGEKADLECRPGEKVEYLTAIIKRIKIGGKEHHVVRDRNVIYRYGDS